MRSPLLVLLVALAPARVLAQDWDVPPPPAPPPPAAEEESPPGQPADFAPPPPPAPASDPLPPPPPPPPEGAEPPAPETAEPAPPPAPPPAGAGTPPPPPPVFGAGDIPGAAAAPLATRTVPVDPYRHSPATIGNEVDSPGNLRRTSTIGGPAGLLHLPAADPGPLHTVRFGLHGGYFRSGGFPVREEPTTSGLGTLTVAFTALDWLEVYGAYAITTTRHRALVGTELEAPQLWQSLGDMWLGGKAGAEVSPGLWLGGDLRIAGYPGVEETLPQAFGVEPTALLTYDARKDLPLRGHLGLGVRFDTTGDLVEGELTPAEAFALGLSEYTRFAIGAGVEVPLPIVTPFVEYGVEIPLGAPAELEQPDGTKVSPASASPMNLTLGARVTAIEDVSFLAAADIGLQQRVVPGVIATPPYRVYLGVTYTFDPLGKREQVIVETPVVADQGKVRGVVLDAATRQPIPAAVLAMEVSGKPGLPPVATDAAGGQFLTYDLPSGPVQIVASKDGYLPATITLVVEAGREVMAEILLTRATVEGTLRVSVKGPAGPIDATVTVEGPKQAELALAGGESSSELPPGSYRLRVSAPGHLSRESVAEVVAGQVASVAFELAKKPRSTVLIIRKDRILTKRTIQFRTGEAEILAESYPILDEVAAAIIDNGYGRVRVEGHTDNVGGKSRNQSLSEARAAAVRDYLVQQAGIDPARLESTGYGDGRPLAPNLTARGRAMNRRVEFAILE